MDLFDFGGLGLRAATTVIKFLTGYLRFVVIRRAQLELYILSSALISVLKILSRSTAVRSKTLVDLVVVDFISNLYRFKLSYNLLSSAGVRVFVNIFLKEFDFVASVSHIYKSAPWLEREAWDLYGVYFINHGDLRRILTDYGFKGFPFRKDFPLTGYVELRFDDSRGDVVYEPVELSQEMRFFNFATGWESD